MDLAYKMAKDDDLVDAIVRAKYSQNCSRSWLDNAQDGRSGDAAQLRRPLY